MATKTCSDLSVDQARTGTLQPGTWLGLLFQVVLSEPRRLALHQARLVRRKAVDSEPRHLGLSKPRRLVRQAVGLVRRQVVGLEPRHLVHHRARSEDYQAALSEPRRLVRRAVGSWSHEAVHSASLVVQPDLATMVASG